MLGSRLHGAAEPAASVSLAGWALALRTQDRLLGHFGGQTDTRQCFHHHLHWWGELCPEHGTAQGQASACAITALVPEALQAWGSADVAHESQIIGDLPDSSAENCGHVPETSWGLGVSCQHLTAPQLLSELCLGFQIRQAESMELLYMNYYYRIKDFFIS